MNFSKPQEWAEWKQRFMRYSSATKLNKEDGEVQVSTLVYALGKEAETVFSSFTFADNTDKKKLDKVMEKFTDHFVPRINVIHERAVFHQRTQHSGETVEAFIRALYALADTCNFGDKKDENIRDKIVVGLTDKTLSRELQMKATLTLDEAIQRARQAELIQQQSDVLAGADIAAVKQTHPKSHVRKPKRDTHNEPKPAAFPMQTPKGKKQCNNCGFSYHRYGRCPAAFITCRKCQRKGHYERCCKANTVAEIASPEDQDSYFLGTIVCSDRNAKPWMVKLNICGSEISFKADSGADATIITPQTWEKLPRKPSLSLPNGTFTGVASTLKPLGAFRARATHMNKTYEFDIHIIKDATSNLLSRGVCKDMGLLSSPLCELSEVHTPATIGLWKTDPVKIKLKDDAKPYHVGVARRVPIPLQEKVKHELERMERDGIIEKVTEPTDWCAPMVATLKKNQQVRICVDLRQLNKAVQRERYILPTFEEIASKLAGATVFSKLDAASGYHQVPLEKESALLTTFITPHGRFCFRRLPFGISSASEIFQRKMNEMLSDLEGVAANQDDIIIAGKGDAEHDARLMEVQRRAAASGLTFNPDKCQFRLEEIEFLGEILTKYGIRPDPKKVCAITALKPPTDVSELKRILGMINYLARYIPNLSTISKPVTELLSKDATWNWGPAQEQCLDKMKSLVTSAPTLAFYDITKPTIVSADASSYGLGAVLWQEHSDTQKPVAFASRTLTPAERNYAQIEKECLASVWACERFHHYLCGLDSFDLITDHKPLVPLINSIDLDKVPLRCQRLLMRLMRYNPRAKHIPGKDMVAADTLSRSPLNMQQSDTDEPVELHVAVTQNDWPASNAKINHIKSATLTDKTLQHAINFTLKGWPKHIGEVPPTVRELFFNRMHLSVSEGLLLYDSRIVIPDNMKAEILNSIHHGHQGITKCIERARQSVWWHGITKDIKDMVSRCTHCQIHRPMNRKEPLITTAMPERPWQHIAMDLAEYNSSKYLIVIDYFSRYLEIINLQKDACSAKVVKALKTIFAHWGIPARVTSDNGPQFSAQEFATFARSYGFDHVTSSPYNPQSNGEAERAVQTAKKILAQDDPILALMIYRATPITATGNSPAQLIMGRQPQTTLPTMEKNLTPNWPELEAARNRDGDIKAKYEYFYNRRHSAFTPAETLAPGDQVRVRTDPKKDWSPPAEVVEHSTTPRSYNIKTDDGQVMRRSRCHLQKLPPKQPDPSPMVTRSKAKEPEKQPHYTSAFGRTVRPVQRLDL